MGKKSGGKQSTTVNPPSFIRPHLEGAAGEASQLFGQGPQQFFPGQTFADFDPLQLQGQQSQLDFAQNQLPGLNQQLFGGFGQSLNTDVTQDPSVQAALDSMTNRATQNFQESILPSLRRGATASGQEFGTRGELAAGVAARDFSRALADAQGAFLGNQLGSARQARSAAMALAPQIASQGLFGGNIMGQIGAQNQAQSQLGINEAMNRFNFEQQAPMDALQSYISQLQGLSGGFSQQNTSQGGGLNPAIGGALGGGLLGAQVGSMVPGFGAGPGTLFGPAGLGFGVGGALLGALLS